MKTKALLLLSIGLSPLALLAAPLYTLDTANDDTGDFNLWQIGSTFSNGGAVSNQTFSYDSVNDTYTLSGRYNQDRAIVLGVPLDTPPTPPVGFSTPAPGGWVDGDIAVALDFNYIANAANSDVIVAVRQGFGQTNYTVNNYPNYYVRLLDNSTFQLVELNGTGGSTVHDTTTLTGLTGSADYRILFSALTDGANVNLSATLFENSVSKGSLSFVDTSPISGGYVGIAGGQGTVNNGTYEGIKISGYQVGTTVIPEPSSLMLISLSALAALGFLRKRR